MTDVLPRTLAAVIEIGSSSIRMAIAQRQGRGLERLADLDLPVGLGRDSFTFEVIASPNIERCVAAIRRFQEVLAEQGVAPQDLRVVATSAVREARNRDVLTDRIWIATGLRVEVLDEVEVSRLTYLAVRPLLRRQSFFRSSSTLVVEVGGGSTEILAFRKGRVDSAHVHRLGSLRMFRELGDHTRAPGGMALLFDYLAAPVAQMVSGLTSLPSPAHLVVLGAETRLVRDALDGADADDLSPLEPEAVRAFIEANLRYPSVELARRLGVSEHQAETLLPSLAVCVALAEAVGARRIDVGDATLRDGVLAEMLGGRTWEDEFRRQTIHSAMALARHYRVDLRHARHVASYARQLLTFMQCTVAFTPQEDILLHVAALLHEVGMFVNSRSYHKHSLYLIENSDLFGLNAREIGLVACIARYHRRAAPRPTHEEFAELPAVERVRVAKLAAILRVADALEFGHDSSTLKLDFRLERDELVILARIADDLPLVRRQLEGRAEMFESVYGLKVVLYPWNRETAHGAT